jgi:hypothetical protein
MVLVGKLAGSLFVWFFTGRGWTFLIVVDSPSLEVAWNHAAYYQEDKD